MLTWQKCHGPEVHITINKHLHLGPNSGQQKSVLLNKPVDQGVDSTSNGRYDFLFGKVHAGTVAQTCSCQILVVS